MAKLILRQEAINDLSDIWEYTSETWSENQADKYYQAIKSACLDISNEPHIGRLYDEISSKVLGYSINKHIIFYHKITAEEIEVVRILHERMDLKRHL
ncbi:type II toxin-antitoxin system RelE/ParE family toxin [Reichenbachiella sp.]|uniref:type II toxin-antitoxin system RelE/ParE family toxin n=1 Tax=Reichenbachiella sp. TaxID=2184521 RepID=UPI003B5B81DF